MSKLHSTLKLARDNYAYKESYGNWARQLGTKWGDDTPFELSDVLPVMGISDTLWLFRCVLPEETQESSKILICFAADVAEHVLGIFEDKYPCDDRPRKAVEAARACVKGDISAAAARAADAAAAAARAAYAAADAAAARAAEVEWQTDLLMRYLRGEVE